jgi:hypothetical protein
LSIHYNGVFDLDDRSSGTQSITPLIARRRNDLAPTSQ